MRAPVELTREPSAPAALRWWTFAGLILYVAGLMVFCGVVTIRSYRFGDSLQPGSVAAGTPPHLPVAPFNVANLEHARAAPRMVCYQVWD